MSQIVELSASQQEALSLIRERDGMTQSELWKTLDASSRTESRLANALVEKGLIEREETIQDGRKTYLLTPVDRPEKQDPATSDDAVQSSSPADTSDTRSDGFDTPTASDATDDQSTDQRALELIRERNGMYQSQLWKELGLDSRKGSRIATRLADEGLIRREEATYNGQRTYLLRPARKDLDFSLLMAGDELSPLVGNEEEIDPIESDWSLSELV